MSNELESLYQQIADSITAQIPKEWRKVKIIIEFKPGVISSQGSYNMPDDAADKDFVVLGNINRLFSKLRDLTQKDANNKAARMIFTIQPQGKFNLEIAYTSE